MLAFGLSRRRQIGKLRGTDATGVDMRSISMRSRVLFFVHALVVVFCLIVGMSETYRCLTWAQLLMPIVPPAGLASMVLPLVILAVGRSEGIPPVRLALAVLLSMAMTTASFLALLPLVSA